MILMNLFSIWSLIDTETFWALLQSNENFHSTKTTVNLEQFSLIDLKMMHVEQSKDFKGSFSSPPFIIVNSGRAIMLMSLYWMWAVKTRMIFSQ